MLCEWRLWSQPRGAGQGARAAAAAEVRQEGKGTPKVGGTAWCLGASRNDRGEPPGEECKWLPTWLRACDSTRFRNDYYCGIHHLRAMFRAAVVWHGLTKHSS
jgi:hypothetical protein